MRGRLLSGVCAALAVSAGLVAGSAQAADTMVYAGYGGAYQEAVRKAGLEPVAKEMGITIKEETITSMADVKLQVEAGSVSIDLSEQNVNDCLVGADQNLWEDLDYKLVDTAGIDPKLVQKKWVGGLTYWSTVLAYSTKKYGANAPQSWADFFDVKKFPGTRGMWNNPYHNIELALLADGVPPEKLYPLDIDRAFKKLNEIKPYITVWWTSGAQAAQLMKDGEVEMSPMWNGRVSAVIKDGAPVGFTYNQGILAMDCMVVPRGAKNKELAMKVLSRLLAPDIQANLPQYIDYGPINPKAFATGKISPAVAKAINSSPENGKLQVTVDDAWWGANQAKVQELWDKLVQQ